MGANVFANGREISGKASSNKTIAAMPDVCMSPPSPPAGPVPIPYPNLSKASDTTGGSKKVKIGGKEVGLKGKSSYKKSKGDEASTRSFGASVVSHVIQGSVKHQAGSFDVKIEGSNAVRFGDLTTGNHNNPGLPPTLDVGGAAPPKGDPDCVELEIEMRNAIKNDTKSGQLGEGQVLVTAKHTTGRSSSFFKAAAPGDIIKSSAQNGYCARQPREMAGGKSVEPKIACTDDRYNSAAGGGAHCEAKVIQTIFGQNMSPGGTLTLRIQWNDEGSTRNEPCQNCKSAICKVVHDCDIKIELCQEDSDGNLKKESPPCKGRKWKPRRKKR